MVFSSVPFLFLFLPIALGLYFMLPGRGRNAFLMLASLLFYTWGEGRLVLIMLTSTAVDYLAALVIARDIPPEDPPALRRTARQRAALAVSVLVNLAMLGTFKYFNFAVDNYNAFLAALGLTDWVAVDVMTIFLPLGISFYTFQSMSYTIDVYRGQVRATRSFIDFACFVSMFPQLVAGPIVRYRDVAEQLISRSTSRSDWAAGIRQFLVGLGKKMLIADTFQEPVNVIFSLPADQLTTATAWLGSVLFTLQLYYDFAGYSDMAIGLGRILGFRFPINFRYPFISRSVGEFWQRWHITLSTWLRDYVYTPLGGSRVRPRRAFFNLMATFFLCGLWHGANWTFILFGVNMGLLIGMERAFGLRERDGWGWNAIGHAYFLLVLAIHMVLFRSPDLTTAGAILSAMFGFAAGPPTAYPVAFFLRRDVLLALIFGLAGSVPLIPWLNQRWNALVSHGGRPRLAGGAELLRQGTVTLALAAVFTACAMRLAADTYQPFIYFRF